MVVVYSIEFNFTWSLHLRQSFCQKPFLYEWNTQICDSMMFVKRKRVLFSWSRSDTSFRGVFTCVTHDNNSKNIVKIHRFKYHSTTICM